MLGGVGREWVRCVRRGGGVRREWVRCVRRGRRGWEGVGKVC